MRKTVLITGGLGYVGGRIAQFLAQKSDYYLLLGTRKKDSPKPDWLINGKLVYLDVLDQTSLNNAVQHADIVIHLAALNEIDCAADAQKAFLINTTGTSNLVEACKNSFVERFIYFSTAHVYGQLKGTVSEATPVLPTHPYAITHKYAENIVLTAKHFKGQVLRLSNAFGAPVNLQVDRWSLLINDLCRQAVTTNQLVLKSNGQQYRNFITLTDVCRAVEFLALQDKQFFPGVINLGSQNNWRVLEMVNLIVKQAVKVMGNEPKVIFPEDKQGMQDDFLLYSIEKLLNTGFVLTNDFELEIENTLKFCMNNFGLKKG
jgi:UDP-glucose 4-epimerase